MTKAYDLGELGKMLMAQGLPLAENGAEAVAKGFFAWLKESAKMSATPYDDVAMVMVPQLEAMVFGVIDKIDGKVGE